MEKLLYINACIRGNDSRTGIVASHIINSLKEKYEIEQIDLTTSALPPIDAGQFKKRGQGVYPPYAIEYAKKFASADRIVIAMPFWDMSFPSVFKVFCENISINGITFLDNEDHSTRGLCKASKIMLITTRGMEIEDNSPLDQGTSYLKALSWLWGIDEVLVVSAIGMDTCDDDTRAHRLNKAIDTGLSLCKEF